MRARARVRPDSSSSAALNWAFFGWSDSAAGKLSGECGLRNSASVVGAAPFEDDFLSYLELAQKWPGGAAAVGLCLSASLAPLPPLSLQHPMTMRKILRFALLGGCKPAAWGTGAVRPVSGPSACRTRARGARDVKQISLNILQWSFYATEARSGASYDSRVQILHRSCVFLTS